MAVVRESSAGYASGEFPPTTVLQNVSWKTYESLLADYEGWPSPRLFYDRGKLEIVSPTPRHERMNSCLSTLVEILTEEWDIEAEAFGSTTFRRADREHGFEPDSCFYIQNAGLMIGRDEIDLEDGDPAPDLVIEIDVYSPSLSKLPLFGQLGVPEVWRVDRAGKVSLLLWDADAYHESEVSRALPLLTRSRLEELLTECRSGARSAWKRRVRAWAQERKTG